MLSYESDDFSLLEDSGRIWRIAENERSALRGSQIQNRTIGAARPAKKVGVSVKALLRKRRFLALGGHWLIWRLAEKKIGAARLKELKRLKCRRRAGSPRIVLNSTS